MVDLNRAVALAEVEGPAAGLEAVEALVAGGRLDAYAPLHAARADLLRRRGSFAEAAASYRRALALAPTEAERRYLAGQLAEVEPGA